ncbi:thrombomodulin [Xyrauchen texanus]|uniref:thrombomodulin n=1 Tax=Xyrauchen texanus TaxID=154827 RepID=UPI0022428481|nr:thrombomodulin [Xyrauchen texanus]
MDSYGQTILFTLFISPCVGMVHHCACSTNLKDCKNLYQMPVDFHTAHEKCREEGGQLMSVRSNKSDEVVGFLLDNTIGHFWIGLHLPEGKCSSNAISLRGYEWTSGGQGTEFSNWGSEEIACAPLCVSISSDRKWMERPCAEKLDGFLCEGDQKNLCTGREASSVTFLDDEQCLSARCEHECTPVAVGYMCSCMQRFRPNARDPHRCDFYCTSTVCEAICARDGTMCRCPDGFVSSEKNCEDIDECESNHDCAQKCVNTIGSYRCACFDPFILVNGTECILNPKFEFTTPSHNYVVRGSLSSPGEYVGLIIFIIMAVFAVLVLVHYLRGRKAAVQECNPSDNEFQKSGSQ